jgi:signal transduction histidine kinase
MVPGSPSHAEQLQALGDLIVALTESRSIGKIFSLLARKLKALLDPEVVQVWMLGAGGRELHQVLTQVDDEHRLAEVLAEYQIEDLATSTFTSAEAVRRREIVVRRATDLLPARVAAIMAAGQVEMTVSIPIIARDEIHGAINMMFRDARPFDREDLRLFDTLGRIFAVAIESARLLDDLARERRWLQTILDELPTAVVMAEGIDGELTRTNKAFEKMLGGVKGLDIPGYRDRFEHADPRTGEPVRWKDLPLARALLLGEAAAAEIRMRQRDGAQRVMLVHGAPLHDPFRHEPAAIVAMQDVTDLKELERQNLRQAQLLQLTFDNVPAGFAILDAEELCFVELNEQFARFFQDPRITRESLLRRKVAGLYPAFESSGLAAIYRRVRDTRAPFTAAAFQFDGLPRGTTHWNVSLLPLEEGARVENLLLFAVEVTGLVEAELRLRGALERAESATSRLEAANRELIEAVRVKDEFLSTLSHELRTPLTPILGWTRILKVHGAEPSLLEQGLRAIERNVMAQVHLVDDLLDLSRLAYDKLRLHREAIELNALLREAWEQVAAQAEEKVIRLVREFWEEPLRVEGDRLRLRQVFANLFENAVKFSEEGGRVEVVSRLHRGVAEVEVADDGIGIEADFLPRIFERFQQAEGGTTRRHGGLGIGLSIAKSLIEMHGGTIAVESAGRGHGSRFRVRLPLAEQP